MIFEKSFLSFVIFCTLVAIYSKDHNEVEANLLEKLKFNKVKLEFDCEFKRRRYRKTSIQVTKSRSAL